MEKFRERERALTLVLLLMLVLGFVLKSKSHDGGKTGQLENSDDTK